MACKGCGGGRRRIKSVPRFAAIEAEDSAAYVLVEYTGSGTGIRTFKINGRMYKVSASETYKRISVHRDDLTALSTRVSLRKVEEPEPAPQAVPEPEEKEKPKPKRKRKPRKPKSEPEEQKTDE